MGNPADMSYVHSEGNQYETVSWSKRPASGAPVKAAPSSRGPSEAVAKFDRAGSDKNRKLDDADEAGRIETVSLDLRIKIQQGRMAKKMTQAQVAKAINEKQQTINEYESGKAVPNQQVLGKLERALGCKLRGGAKKKPAAKK